jgi:hypothetical protein
MPSSSNKKNPFTPENVSSAALVAVGMVEDSGTIYGESTQDRLTLSIDSSSGGVLLRCESAMGFSASVRIGDAINTTTNNNDDDLDRVELESQFINVVHSDGTVIDCSGALILSNCQMLLFAKEQQQQQYGWFWLEVRPSFRFNAVRPS